MIVTDAFLNIEQDQTRLWFLDVTASGELINNSYFQDKGPQLRRRQNDLQDDDSDEKEIDIHTIKPLHNLPIYEGIKGQREDAPGKMVAILMCGGNRSHKTADYCRECSPSGLLQRQKTETLNGIKSFCYPTTERSCFLEHTREL